MDMFTFFLEKYLEMEQLDDIANVRLNLTKKKLKQTKKKPCPSIPCFNGPEHDKCSVCT